MKITLGEVGTYINGYAFKPSDWGTRGLPIIRIQNLTNQNTVPNYFDGPYNPKFEVNKGDILIAWSGSLGIHIWQKNRALLNQHIFRVEFNKCDIDKMYFYYAVKHNIHKMLHLTHGATMRHIIKSDFEQIVIPYPSLEVQANISKILNYLEQNIINFRNILLKLELLIKSRFVEMFGDITARGRFKVKRWKDILDILNGRDYKNVLVNKGGYPVYGSGGIIARASDYICPAGTIIIGRKGSINNPILVNEKFWNVDTAFGIVPKETINKNYLFYFCKQYNFNRLNKATTLPSLTKQDLLEIEINIPDLEKQVKFSRFVDQINKLKSDVQKSINETQLLMDSLMQEYFG
ncbi:restriction endonuclease subunit S [Veillonella parvula]|uniref:restriction endonuclease subunit S n=1 Tax=Veillonella parvula TaxID=29466 RepID=UPI002914E38A|nr:restriction endonuclease subunit S [Veillonella parvula]MDU5557596.1 restriction endonuclease subunit S [Veillonella parvula]